MTLYAVRRLPSVPLRARALPAQANPRRGRFRKGGEAPPPSVLAATEGALEILLDDIVQPLPEAPIAGHEEASPRRQLRASRWSAPGRALQEFESGRVLELP